MAMYSERLYMGRVIFAAACLSISFVGNMPALATTNDMQSSSPEKLVASPTLASVRGEIVSSDANVAANGLRSLWYAPEFVYQTQYELLQLTHELNSNLDSALIIQGSFRPVPFWAKYDSKDDILLGIIAESIRQERCKNSQASAVPELETLLTDSLVGVGPVSARTAIDCLFYSIFYEQPRLLFEPPDTTSLEKVLDLFKANIQTNTDTDTKIQIISRIVEAAYALPDKRKALVSLLDSNKWAEGFEPGEAAAAVSRMLAHYGEPGKEAYFCATMALSEEELLTYISSHPFDGARWATHYYALRYKLERSSHRETIVQQLLSKSKMHSLFIEACLPNPLSVESDDETAKHIVNLCIQSLGKSLDAIRSDENMRADWEIRSLHKLVATRRFETFRRAPTQSRSSDSSNSGPAWMVPYGIDGVIDILVGGLSAKNLHFRTQIAYELGQLSYLSEQAASTIEDALTAALTETDRMYDYSKRTQKDQVGFDVSVHPEWALRDALLSAKEDASSAVAYFGQGAPSKNLEARKRVSILASPEQAAQAAEIRSRILNSGPLDASKTGEVQRVSANGSLPSTAGSLSTTSEDLRAVMVSQVPYESHAPWWQPPWWFSVFVAVILPVMAIALFLVALRQRRLIDVDKKKTGT